MKTRVISAAAAIVLLAIIVYLGATAIGIAVTVLAILSVREFNSALRKGGYKPIGIISLLSCLPLLYIALLKVLPAGAVISGSDILLLAAIYIFAVMLALFCILMFSDGKYGIKDAAVTLFGIMYIVFMFSFISLTCMMELGHLYIWLIFIGACATDTFAFFTGITIGKTKIVPKISPKKSLEGCIGGVAGCVAAMALFGVFFSGETGIPVLHFAILGFLCGIISQLGDWSASVVKRAVGIKDYGSIMPGHGGVLDRLDSIIFTAPTVFLYINLFF
jgi:phosphatidate cytidylyltransferase